MERFTETVYDVLFHPATALRQIAAEKQLAGAAAVFCVSLLLPAWTVYLLLVTSGLGKVAGIVLIAQIGCSLLLWILGTAFYQLAAEFMGGTGTALGLFAAMGFAQLPRVFIVPMMVLAALLSGVGAKVLTLIWGLAIGLWVLVLQVKAIQAAHHLSLSRAMLVFFSPLAVIFCLGILVAIGVGISIMY